MYFFVGDSVSFRQIGIYPPIWWLLLLLLLRWGKEGFLPFACVCKLVRHCLVGGGGFGIGVVGWGKMGGRRYCGKLAWGWISNVCILHSNVCGMLMPWRSSITHSGGKASTFRTKKVHPRIINDISFPRSRFEKRKKQSLSFFIFYSPCICSYPRLRSIPRMCVHHLLSPPFLQSRIAQFPRNKRGKKWWGSGRWKKVLTLDLEGESISLLSLSSLPFPTLWGHRQKMERERERERAAAEISRKEKKFFSGKERTVAAASPPLNRVQGEGKISCWRQRKEERKRSPLCPSFFHSCWHHSSSSSYISFPRTERGPRKQPPHRSSAVHPRPVEAAANGSGKEALRFPEKERKKEREKVLLYFWKLSFLFAPALPNWIFELVLFSGEVYFFFILGKRECVCVFCVVLCAFTGFCCSAALLACFLSSRRSAFVCIYTGEEGEERGRGKKCSTFPHSTEL